MLIYQMLKVRDNIRMDMYQHRRERLLGLIKAEYNDERVRFCDKTGISESRLAQLLSTTYRNGTAFTEKTARKLEEAAGLFPLYFDQGATPGPTAEEWIAKIPGAMRVQAVDDSHPSRTAIRKVKLRVRAGITGFQVEPEYYDGETTTVPTEWMERHGFVRDALLSIVVDGDSMSPNIHEGDTIVVNTRDTKLVSGAVYVVNYEGEAVVKRMVRDAGQWWLTSDNPDQTRYHRQLCKGAECIVIGKVVRKESSFI